jgi:hypothetical protein
VPDPADPTPVRVVQRGGGWVAVAADGTTLEGQTPGSRAEAEALAARVNQTWKRAKGDRVKAGSPAITEAVRRVLLDP